MATILRWKTFWAAALLLCSMSCRQAPRPPARSVSARPAPATVAPSARRRDRPADELPALLLDAERKAWQGLDARPFLSLFAPAAEVIGGRGEQSGPLDVKHPIAQWSTLLAWQLSGRRPNIDDTNVSHENVEVQRHGGEVQVQLTRVINAMIVKETVRERFSFVLGDEGWRVSRLRWWPIEVKVASTTIDYGPEGLRKLDAAADAIALSDPRKKAAACFEALRYTESVRWYEALVSTADGTPHDWLELGWSAAFAGQMQRSREAFREAAKRDPTLLVPPGALGAEGTAGTALEQTNLSSRGERGNAGTKDIRVGGPASDVVQ